VALPVSVLWKFGRVLFRRREGRLGERMPLPYPQWVRRAQRWVGENVNVIADGDAIGPPHELGTGDAVRG
jgi:hypothetical protein